AAGVGGPIGVRVTRHAGGHLIGLGLYSPADRKANVAAARVAHPVTPAGRRIPAMDRRTFLAGTVAAAAASRLHAAAQGSSAAAPPSDSLRIGFAGMGARAHELVDAIAATGTGAEVVALCDAYRGRAERGRARTGGT